MTTPLIKMTLEVFDDFLKIAFNYFRKGHIEDPGFIIDHFYSAYHLPLNNNIKELIVHPYFVYRHIEAVASNLNYNIGKIRLNNLDKLRCLMSVEQYSIRFRQFIPQPRCFYYGQNFTSDESHYLIWDEVPVLIIKIRENWVKELNSGSEFGWITRPEVRILSALAFSTSTGSCDFYMSEKTYDFPISLITKDPFTWTVDNIERIKYVAIIMNRIENKAHQGFGLDRSNISDASYSFQTYGINPHKAQYFYDMFDINDNLSLRTSYYLLKSNMLWHKGGRIFADDACANLFFGLEGCLRLINYKIIRSKNFEVKPVLDFIEKNFLHAPGYVDCLMDAYNKRIKLVHPEPKLLSQWVPVLLADDYYEYYEMAIDLIYYAVTGELIPREL